MDLWIYYVELKGLKKNSRKIFEPWLFQQILSLINWIFWNLFDEICSWLNLLMIFLQTINHSFKFWRHFFLFLVLRTSDCPTSTLLIKYLTNSFQIFFLPSADMTVIFDPVISPPFFILFDETTNKQEKVAKKIANNEIFSIIGGSGWVVLY